MKHEVVNWNLRDLAWAKRTAAMQSWFRERGVTPPKSVGNLEEGTPEIVTITDAYYNGKFFADVEVGVCWKQGAEPVPFVIRSNIGGPGDVFIPEINGMIPLVGQWRPVLGEYRWEIPRGFSQEWEAARSEAITVSAETLPKNFSSVIKELVEEVGTGNIVEVQFLGEIAENSGTTSTSPRYWWLRLDEARIRGTEGLNVKLIAKDQIMSLVGSVIKDQHSLAALVLWAKATGRIGS